MFDLFLPVAFGLAAIVDAQTSVRILNLDELITAEDYPAIAIDEDQQGTATIRLKINRNGYVEACRIVESSGHTALDEQSCAVYRARARFEPSRDSKGRTVASEFQQRVVWRLAGDRPDPMPRQAWMTRSTMAISADRGIIDCKAEAVGLSVPPFDCKALMALAERDDFLAAKGTPITGYVINEIHFYPGPAEKFTPPPTLLDANLQKQQISEIVIGPDGRVSRCKGVRYSGTATRVDDACPSVRGTRFSPEPGKPDLTGTVVMTVYARVSS